MRALSAFALATALTLPLASPLAAEEKAAALITVTGEGVVRAAPDQAMLMIGVTTQAETAAAALEANSTALTAVLARLKEVGIAELDMQTSNLSINPNWTGYDSGASPTISSYMAMNQLDVRIRTLDSLGAVVDAAVSDGANTLNGLTFGVTDPKPLLDQARSLAVADARARAEVLVTAAGGRLGRIVSISEGGGFSGPAPMFRADQSTVPGVPVQGGEVGLTSTVTLTYEILDQN
jgi:uncharacterized protein YggE